MDLYMEESRQKLDRLQREHKSKEKERGQEVMEELLVLREKEGSEATEVKRLQFLGQLEAMKKENEVSLLFLTSIFYSFRTLLSKMADQVFVFLYVREMKEFLFFIFYFYTYRWSCTRHVCNSEMSLLVWIDTGESIGTFQ